MPPRMGTVALQDITVVSLARISTAGGEVMHALKSSDSEFVGFGEAYFSRADFNMPKAWKRHTKMTMNLLVPVGTVRFVFHVEGREEFRVEEIGAKRYSRITVPPGVWFGFKGLELQSNLVLNIASIPHDPAEVERKSVNDFTYDWN